ncbi:MAG: DUF2284 domain-containing protein [Alistipes sp.]
MSDMRPNNPTEEPLAVRTYAFASLPAEEYIRRYRDAERFAGLCRQCGRYGRCWACPPFSFDAEEYLSGFGTAHLIAARIEPGERLRALCADAGQSEKQGRALLNEARCELDARLLAMEEAWPGSRAFFAGTCFDCPAGTCTRPSDLPCVRPGKIRPSLEALGFDLGRTAAELLGIELRWSTDGRLPEYFTLISGFLPIIRSIRCHGKTETTGGFQLERRKGFRAGVADGASGGSLRSRFAAYDGRCVE